MLAEELREFRHQTVVVDTATSLIYLGVLAEVSPGFLTLHDVDVHDVSEGASTKELYALEARKFGVKANRRSAKVRLDVVVSISRLEDVIDY